MNKKNRLDYEPRHSKRHPDAEGDIDGSVMNGEETGLELDENPVKEPDTAVLEQTTQSAEVGIIGDEPENTMPDDHFDVNGDSGKPEPADVDEPTGEINISKTVEKDLYFSDDAGKKRSRRKKKKKGRVGRVLLTILLILVLLIGAAVGAYYVMNEMGRRSIHNHDGMEVIMPTEVESGKTISSDDKYGRIITYDGVSYTYNDDVAALTFIGVDKGKGVDKQLRMADCIYILTMDVKTGKTKIIGVSRDIMTDVNVYSEEGTYIDAEELQISYSYAYHNDLISSGENTLRSVSRLFFGLPLKDYFAINLEAMADLNDAIGGVTVKSRMTFVSPEDGRTINEGDTVTLHGKEAEYYVQHRDITVLESNRDRMLRQQDYIKAIFSSVFEAAKKDISVISKLYNVVSSQSDSSIDLSELTYYTTIALTKLPSTDAIEYDTLKGKTVAGVNAEMFVTNDEILRVMLDTFYTPVSEKAE